MVKKDNNQLTGVKSWIFVIQMTSFLYMDANYRYRFRIRIVWRYILFCSYKYMIYVYWINNQVEHENINSYWNKITIKNKYNMNLFSCHIIIIGNRMQLSVLNHVTHSLNTSVKCCLQYCQKFYNNLLYRCHWWCSHKHELYFDERMYIVHHS